MITKKTKQNDPKEIENILHPIVKEWFFSRFKAFSLPQRFGVMEIHSRKNILVSAPTGATKTLTGFLSILNELIDSASKGILEDRVYCVYISPLKALNNDIQKNLKEPLEELQKIAKEKFGIEKDFGIRVGVRTGDTTQKEKADMLKNPPHILITTPESINIMMTSPKFSLHLHNVDWLIVDEIHALADNKRGVDLSIAMERLNQISPAMTRVGLSATVAPIEEVAKFLVGFHKVKNKWEERNCEIVDVQFIKQLDLQVMSPVDNLIDTPHEVLHTQMYRLIDNLIQKHKTTLIFTNTRAATERVVDHLKNKFPSNYMKIEDEGDDKEENHEIEPENKTKEEVNEKGEIVKKGRKGSIHKIDKEYLKLKKEFEQEYSVVKLTKGVKKDKSMDEQFIQGEVAKEAKLKPGTKAQSLIGAHHGSLSKKHRHTIESQLREGKLKAVVCSTSLELGIDIGYIDLVILLGSPKSVARALQRIGRSGHQLHETTKGRIIVLDRDDLVECAVLLKNAVEKKIDRLHIPTNALDVLAQQIYGIAITQKIHINDLFKMIRQTYCYHNLSRKDFNEVIDYLSGKFAELEDRYIYGKIWYDEETGLIGRKGRLARVIYMTNIGTIPDEAFITVKIGTEIVGFLDEGFLEKMKPGDVFVLGGNTYQFKYAKGTVAQVKASVNRPPTVPRWVSESLPLSFDLAISIGKFRRLIQTKFDHDYEKEEILEFINKYLYVDDKAANAIYEYFKEQYEFAEIPTVKKILIEKYDDDRAKYVFFHTLYGRRVNDCLSRSIGLAISRTEHKDVEIGINDNGFYLAFQKNVPVMRAFSLVRSDKLELILNAALEKTEVLNRRFRHCATRSLMILRNYGGRTKRVGRQQVSSMILMSAVRRLDQNFSILREARREVLEDLMDIHHTKEILKDIEDGKIKVKEITTTVPSPFAFNFYMQGYTDVLKIEDKIEFLKRMHQMVKAKISLKKIKKGDKDELESVQELESENKLEAPTYEEVWDREEEDKRKEKEKSLDELKREALNLKKVPSFVKREILKIVEGDTDIRPDVIVEIKKHRVAIKKFWSKSLAKLVLDFVDDL
ncbi:DEAD/DEAH box helicase [Nanoarchaeota archaeon]